MYQHFFNIYSYSYYKVWLSNRSAPTVRQWMPAAFPCRLFGKGRLCQSSERMICTTPFLVNIKGTVQTKNINSTVYFHTQDSVFLLVTSTTSHSVSSLVSSTCLTDPFSSLDTRSNPRHQMKTNSPLDSSSK